MYFLIPDFQRQNIGPSFGVKPPSGHRWPNLKQQQVLAFGQKADVKNHELEEFFCKSQAHHFLNILTQHCGIEPFF